MIGAIVPLVKMFFSVSIGEVDDHEDIRSVILWSKGLYIMVGVLYFLSGILHSLPLLLTAGIVNGIVSAGVFTSYGSLIRKRSTAENKSTAFGLYFSAYNFAYIVAAPIIYFTVSYIPLPYVFLGLALFSAVSLYVDTKLPKLSKKKLRDILGKEGFLHNLLRRVFCFSSIKKGFSVLKYYDKKMYAALSYEWIHNLLNYVGFIFIPIIAVQNNISLPQVVIIFAVMRAPYIVSFFSGEIADKYSKRRFILITLLFLSFLFAMLGLKETFRGIMILSLGISMGLALIRPVIS